MRYVLLLVTAGLLAAPAAGQSCSSLSVSGNLQPGDQVAVSLGDSFPDAATFLAVSTQQGTSVVDLGSSGDLKLALAEPFVLMPVGMSDASGGFKASYTIPDDVSASVLPPDLRLQAISVRVSYPDGVPILKFCVSNVASL